MNYMGFLTKCFDGSLVTTKAGRILSADSKTVSLLGLSSKEELLSKDASWMYTHPEQRPRFWRTLERKGFLVNQEVSIRGGLWIRLSALLIETAGEPGALVFFHDISHEHELEKEVAHQHKMEAAGEILAGLAHDLRNVLLVVSTQGNELRDLLGSPDTPENRESVLQAATYLTEASHSAANLLERLVRVKEPDELDLRPLDLRAFVAEKRPLIRHVAGAQVSVIFQLGTPDHPAQALADPLDLERVFLNLVLNAVEAMPRGGVLRISLTHRDGKAIIDVCDSGVGIPEELKERLFEPFSSSKGRRGAGIGLASCRRSLSRLGGTIRLLSTAAGVGTTFRMEIPLTTRPVLSPGAISQNAARRGAPGRPETINAGR